MFEIRRQVGVKVRELNKGNFTVGILINLVHKLIKNLLLGLFTVSVVWVTLKVENLLQLGNSDLWVRGQSSENVFQKSLT